MEVEGVSMGGPGQNTSFSLSFFVNDSTRLGFITKGIVVVSLLIPFIHNEIFFIVQVQGRVDWNRGRYITILAINEVSGRRKIVPFIRSVTRGGTGSSVESEGGGRSRQIDTFLDDQGSIVSLSLGVVGTEILIKGLSDLESCRPCLVQVSDIVDLISVSYEIPRLLKGSRRPTSLQVTGFCRGHTSLHTELGRSRATMLDGVHTTDNVNR